MEINPVKLENPVENNPPANVEVELLPKMVVVAVPPTPRLPRPVMSMPKEKVEDAVVEVAARERNVGVTSSTSLNSWLSEPEVIIREVFCPAAVENVWTARVWLFSVVIPLPDPVPKQLFRAVTNIHPALRVMPLLNEDVAPEVSRIFPPVMVSPCDDESPAVPNGPAHVEVPVMLEEKVDPESIVRVVPVWKFKVPEV